MTIRTGYSYNLQQLEELVEKLRIREGWVRNSIQSLKVRENHGLYNAVLRRVEAAYNEADEKTLAFLSPENQLFLQGELSLGTVIGDEGIRLNIPIAAIPRHLFIAGSSGSGKSEFAKCLVERVRDAGVSSIRVVDPKASEFVTLARKYRQFLCLNWSDLRFNIFTPPPNVPWIEWIQSVVSHLSEAFNFWEGTEALLLKHLIKLKQADIELTVPHLIRSLQSDRGIFGQKDAMTRSTAMSRLEMLDNLFGPAISTNSAVLVHLSNRASIISTSGLMSTAESWFAEYLLLWEHLYRKYNPDSRVLTLHIYDECQHRLFSSQKERSQHQTTAPLVSKLVDEARSLGLGICSLSQEPSTVIKAIQNNAWLRVAFRLGSGTEIRVVREAMGLTDDQANVLFYLEPGEAIVRLAGGYMEPMLVKFDEFEQAAFCSEGEFRKYQEELKQELYREAGVRETAPLVEYVPSISNTLSGDTDHNQRAIKPTTKTNSALYKSQPQTDQTAAVKPLLSIWLNLPYPFLTQGELFLRAGIMSGSKQSSIKNQLVTQGFVIEHRLQIGKTFATILEPTGKAFDLIGNAKPSFHSKGGYLHQFIAHRVCEWAIAKNLNPKVEFMLSNGKAVDVAWQQSDNGWVFGEIVVSKPWSKEALNLDKDVSSDLRPTKILVLAVDSKVKAELSELFSSEPQLAECMNCIEVRLAGEFMKA